MSMLPHITPLSTPTIPQNILLAVRQVQQAQQELMGQTVQKVWQARQVMVALEGLLLQPSRAGLAKEAEQVVVEV
jgi:hypothetical protein